VTESAAAPATATCLKCKQPVDPETAKRRQHIKTGADVFLHVECWAEYLRQREADERLERERAERLDADRRKRVADAKRYLAGGLPPWEWCRVDAPEFRQRIRDPKLVAFAAHWTPEHGSAALFAPSGAGKTSACIAAVWRNASEIDESNPDVTARNINGAMFGDDSWKVYGAGPIGHLKWVQGCDLALAQRRSKLGEEPAIVAKAKDCGLLIIDEMGYESREPEPVFLEVIDHRYRNKEPTVVTSGLTRIEFETRYGTALLRRLTDTGIGKLIDCHPKAKGSNG